VAAASSGSRGRHAPGAPGHDVDESVAVVRVGNPEPPRRCAALGVEDDSYSR